MFIAGFYQQLPVGISVQRSPTILDLHVSKVKYLNTFFILLTLTANSTIPFYHSPALLWSLLLILLLIIRVSIVTCITAGSLLINNAATPDKLGTMNGIALTMLSAGRYAHACYIDKPSMCGPNMVTKQACTTIALLFNSPVCESINHCNDINFATLYKHFVYNYFVYNY